MKQEHIDILKAAADLMIETVSRSIINDAKNKIAGRNYLKEVIAASESLDLIKVENGK